MTATEILPGLWLGALPDADTWTGHRINLCDMPFGVDAVPRARVEAENVHRFLESHNTVLVHCGGGVDRSPFVIALYLVTHHGMSWDAAYALIRGKRPIVVDHRDWLQPPYVPGGA